MLKYLVYTMVAFKKIKVHIIYYLIDGAIAIGQLFWKILSYIDFFYISHVKAKFLRINIQNKTENQKDY